MIREAEYFDRPGKHKTSTCRKILKDLWNESLTHVVVATTGGDTALTFAEIVAEACDGGLVPEGADVVAVAGTGRGADTVAIIEAHPSHRFLETRIKQIVAEPL